MIKKILATLAMTLVGLVGTLVVTSPAQASWSDCAAYQGTVCFHQHANFTGQVWRQYPGQIIGCRDLVDFNDTASTFFNGTDDHIVRIYEHANCAGAVFALSPGEERSFGSTNTWWNDRASSVRVQWVGN